MCHPEVPAGQPTPEVTSKEVNVPVGGEQMPCLQTLPEGGHGPAVLIIADIFGRSPFYEGLAARLATAGFTALLPEFFFRQGPLAERNFPAAAARRGQLDEHQSLRDFSAAVDWLRQQHETQGNTVGTLGFCMGGTFALQLTAAQADLATVCYYGFPAGPPHATEGNPPTPLQQLDGLKGPILGFWGDQDENVGMHNVAALADGLRERDVEFTHTVYPGLGHGFLSASQLDPDHDAYEAACESWTHTIEFYRKHLATGTVPHTH